MRGSTALALLGLVGGCGLSIDFLAPEGQVEETDDGGVEPPPDVGVDSTSDAMDMPDAVQVDANPDGMRDCTADPNGDSDWDNDGIPDYRDPWACNFNLPLIRHDFTVDGRGSWNLRGGASITSSGVLLTPDASAHIDSLPGPYRYVEVRVERDFASNGRIELVVVTEGDDELFCMIDREETDHIAAEKFEVSGVTPTGREPITWGGSEVYLRIHADDVGNVYCTGFGGAGERTPEILIGSDFTLAPRFVRVNNYSQDTHDLGHAWIHEGPSTP